MQTRPADDKISAGGPTGLFTGLLLHQMGVSVCIIGKSRLGCVESRLR